MQKEMKRLMRICSLLAMLFVIVIAFSVLQIWLEDVGHDVENDNQPVLCGYSAEYLADDVIPDWVWEDNYYDSKEEFLEQFRVLRMSYDFENDGNSSILLMEGIFMDYSADEGTHVSVLYSNHQSDTLIRSHEMYREIPPGRNSVFTEYVRVQRDAHILHFQQKSDKDTNMPQYDVTLSGYGM